MADHIFISYAREDQSYARKLADELKQQGFAVWLDDRIDSGERWWRAIVQAIRECAALMVVMTPEAEDSEWEKGARGTDGRIYPWGNDWDPAKCNTAEGKKGGTSPVGAYPSGASPYGLLDMAGNVWEWCATQWRKPYPYDLTQDEWADEYLQADRIRVLRGGSWNHDRLYARCTYCGWSSPAFGGDLVGFRLVSPI